MNKPKNHSKIEKELSKIHYFCVRDPFHNDPFLKIDLAIDQTNGFFTLGFHWCDDYINGDDIAYGNIKLHHRCRKASVEVNI